MSAFFLARLGVTPEVFGKWSYGFAALVLREVDAEDVRYHFPAASIQATLANTNRDPSKKPVPFDPWDFMPGWRLKAPEDEKPIPPTRDEAINILGLRKFFDGGRGSKNRRA